MRPDLFPLFVWRQLTAWSAWLNAVDHPGRADVVGAGATSLLVALGVVAYARRRRLAPVSAWIQDHPALATALIAPAAALVLICLSKFATFIGSTLTVVGLLIALDNNRRGHARETKRSERQEMAARTALTHELSAVCGWCEELVEALLEGHHKDAAAFDVFVRSERFPRLPPTTTATIKDMILSTDNAAVAQRCAHLQRYIQLITANLRATSRAEGLRDGDLNTQLMRAVILYGIATSLFGFAREDDPGVGSLEWDDIERWTMFVGLYDHADFQAYLQCAQKVQGDPLYFNSRRLIA